MEARIGPICCGLASNMGQKWGFGNTKPMRNCWQDFRRSEGRGFFCQAELSGRMFTCAVLTKASLFFPTNRASYLISN